MKTYTLTFAQAIEHAPEHPERTARRNNVGTLNFDVTFRVWPNRPSLAKTVRLQEKREPQRTDWKPCVPLGLSEGY